MVVWATDIRYKVLIYLSHIFHDPLTIDYVMNVRNEVGGQGLIPLSLNLLVDQIVTNFAHRIVELVVAGYHDEGKQVGYSVFILLFKLVW